MKHGDFSKTPANRLGIGKLQGTRAGTATIEYFLAPGLETENVEVPFDSVTPASLPDQTRVYVYDAGSFSWRAGRGFRVDMRHYYVHFPNGQKELIENQRLFARCNRVIADPTAFLAARITESPFFHTRRAAIVKAFTEQREACAGMTGLLSATINLEPHQIEVIRRVLQDSTMRYLLADEVGLGKTVEAGVIIRQFILDGLSTAQVLIVVPPHLIRQWHDELTHRFQLEPMLGRSIHLVSCDDENSLEKLGPSAGLVVVDEAHQLATWVAATEGTPERRRFDLVRQAAVRPAVGLLLLSATPALHTDETGFQALLHLLDPVVYPLGDMAGFRERRQRHQEVATLYHQFHPDEAGHYLEAALDRLTEYFPADRKLANLALELRPLLVFGADPSHPRRLELVRTVRTHISETYRLHRRLLRNRRADPRIEKLLPGRARSHVCSYVDPAAVHLGVLLEEWRVLAAQDGNDVDRRSECFRLMADAAACDATALAAVVAQRRGHTCADHDLGLAERELAALRNAIHFPGEEEALRRLASAAEADESLAKSDRLLVVLEQIFGASPETRVVVFASYPIVADELYCTIRAKWPCDVVRHGTQEWKHFRAFRVLVCDRRAEEGLNLQWGSSVAVHYDLPWSPNRIEQRTGRLDRYGGGLAWGAKRQKVYSVVLLADGDFLGRAWFDYLDGAYRIFHRSVASLQYLVDAEMRAVVPAALLEGAEAFAASAKTLGGPKGSIERSLEEIEILDELDAVEVPPRQQEFAERLARIDLERSLAWEAAWEGWLHETLEVKRIPEQGNDFRVRRYQYETRNGNPRPLMPVNRFGFFAHAIDQEHDRSAWGPVTHPLCFDRSYAQQQRAAVARVGNPFVDSMARYVRWDDRGMCFALWRYRPGVVAHHPADIFLRFDFVVECALVTVLNTLQKYEGFSAAAVQRQADWMFPPLSLSIWLDQHLEFVTEPTQRALLEQPYQKRVPGGGRDYNMGSRWQALGTHFPRAQWVSLIEAARSEAERQVRSSAEFADRVEQRLADARNALIERDAQFASRQEFLTLSHRAAESSRAAADRAVIEALIEGIQTPSVRLDSLGAVLLANWDPFEEDEG